MRLNFSHKKGTSTGTAIVYTVWYVRALILVFILAFSTSLFATENSVETTVKNKGTTIVFKATGENSVVITEGTITAEQGKSIKLLPGTHLKGEQPVKASIVSRERHEAMVKIARQETERKFFVAVFEHLKNANTFGKGHRIVGDHLPLPGDRTLFAQQVLFCSALPVPSSHFFQVVALVLNTKTSIKNSHNFQVSAFKALYNPDNSWGNCGATTAVMLC